VFRREVWAEPTFSDHADAQREVETRVKASRGKTYPPGSYSTVEWSPDPQTVVNDRAEYRAWVAALAALAEALHEKLDSRIALEPRAARAPWAGESDQAEIPNLFSRVAERVYEGDAAATLALERAAGRRRPVHGGNSYGSKPVRPAKGVKHGQ
jgi:hypothetical protein